MSTKLLIEFLKINTRSKKKQPNRTIWLQPYSLLVHSESIIWALSKCLPKQSLAHQKIEMYKDKMYLDNTSCVINLEKK
jgi:hypothetical protein